MATAELYQYQERVDELLRAGRSIILQAPTGAGKTRAALFPFLAAWRDPDAATFPRQCLYCVPMRVLANQFEAQYRETVSRYATRYGLEDVGEVRVQTGARPEDRKLEADLIFTTLDQALSSFLAVPYSLGQTQANLNAGAVIGSYLVFDEFHLFPVDRDGYGALTTTLQMLQMLKGVAPYVLMTATFSETMIRRLATLLDAEPMIVKGSLLDDIPAQQDKQRLISRCDHELDAEVVWDDFQRNQRTRSIAICNTVERAQQLGLGLMRCAEGTDVQVEVLHSWFFRKHRDTKEDNIRREFAEQSEDAPTREWPRAILVATQAVEVGLNITCEALHTEVAPAAAIIQRAGRCARFEGESGEMFVYDVPPNKQGEPDYAPYLDEGQSELCSKTWQALEGYQCRVLDFEGELALVEEVHREYDTRLLDRLDRDAYELRREIGDTWRTCDRGRAPKLIRSIDNCTVLIHPNPSSNTMPDPYAWEGISLRRGRLLRWWKEDQEAGANVDWMAQYPHDPQKIEDVEQEERKRVVYEWRKLSQGADSREVATAGLLVINPVLVAYSEAIGFRFEPGDPEFTQLAPAKKPRRPNQESFGYKRETYLEHITRLRDAYTGSLRDQTAAVRERMALRLGLPEGAVTLDKAIRLMIATHDIGKLDEHWQKWARRWQAEASNLPSAHAAVQPRNYIYAHTDYDPDDPPQKALHDRLNRQEKRPHHAAESARAAWQLLHAISGESESLYKALLSAIARHHAALAEGANGRFSADTGNGKNYYAAKLAFGEAMSCVGLLDTPELKDLRVEWQFDAGRQLCQAMVDPEKTDEMLLYLLLARILRLCDQRALDF